MPRPPHLGQPADSFETQRRPLSSARTETGKKGAASGASAVAQLQLLKARLPDKPTALRATFEALPQRGVVGGVRLIEGNTEAWLSSWHVLDTAPRGIDATYFIFQRDIFGMAFLGQLLRKVRAGEKVRLMIDAMGDSFGRKGFTLTFRGQDYLQELVNTGNAQVRVYHPIHKKILHDAFKPGTLTGIAVNHDKLVRSDTFALTGGRNVSKDYYVDPKDRDDVYRDCDVLVEGREASLALKASFDEEFDNTDLLYSVKPDMFGNWAKRDIELLGAYLMMDTWLNDPTPLSEAEKEALRKDPSARESRAEALLDRMTARLPEEGIDRAPSAWDLKNLRKLARELVGYAELHGAYRSYDPKEGMRPGAEVKALDRTSAAAHEVDDIGSALLKLAGSAKERILIQNPYVILTDKALAALKAAGERGVKIDLVTNSPDSTDSVMTQAFFLEDWPRLLAEIPNLRIFVFTGKQKLHAKVALADDDIAAVTSFNLDLLSARVSGEMGVVAWSKELNADLRAAIAQDFANPLQGVKEYTILRDESGKPVFRDGEPVITYGAKDHTSPGMWRKYSVLRWVANQLRRLPALAPIRHQWTTPS